MGLGPLPIGPNDIAELIKAGILVVGMIERERKGKLLSEWAKMLDAPDSNERATSIRQFLQDRTQDAGFSPTYSWTDAVAVPVDQLTDLVDLLVAGPPNTPTGGFLASIIGSDDVTKQARIKWAEAFKTKDTTAILEMLTGWMAQRGRVRWYSPSPAIEVDADWLADSGSAIIG